MMLRKDWNFCLSKCIQRYANISKSSNELFTLTRKYLLDFGFLFGFYNIFILDWILRKAIKAVKIWRSWAFLIYLNELQEQSFGILWNRYSKHFHQTYRKAHAVESFFES